MPIPPSKRGVVSQPKRCANKRSAFLKRSEKRYIQVANSIDEPDTTIMYVKNFQKVFA